ncbi:hypothetical protein ACFYT4_36235, partial [Streptomyces sp. NPDC004609]
QPHHLRSHTRSTTNYAGISRITRVQDSGSRPHLSLHKLSQHALTEHHEYLHNRTGGYFLALSQLICQAATLAILTGTENITRTELDAIHVGRGH